MTKTTRDPILEAPIEAPEPVSPDCQPPADPPERTSQVAALVLEVLAGARSAGEAAESIGVSLSRYYLIEKRAVAGLVAACALRPRGPRRDPQRQLEKLQAEVARLERECRRSQSLLRVAQRSSELGAALSQSPRPAGKSERKRRRRAKAARALLVARELRRQESQKIMDQATASADNGQAKEGRKR